MRHFYQYVALKISQNSPEFIVDSTSHIGPNRIRQRIFLAGIPVLFFVPTGAPLAPSLFTDAGTGPPGPEPRLWGSLPHPLSGPVGYLHVPRGEIKSRCTGRLHSQRSPFWESV